MLGKNELAEMVAEVFERAKWYGRTGHYQSEMFGMGYISARYGLERKEIAELLAAVNDRIAKNQQDEYAEELIQSAIRNVN